MTAEAQMDRGVGSEDPQLRKWERFFKDIYKARINEAAHAYPKKRTLLVDYWTLDRYDQQLAQTLLDQPDATIALAEKALRTVDVALDQRPQLHVRFSNLPEHATVEVRDLRAEHMGKLLAVHGLVKKATEVRPRIQDAVFECQRCGCAIQEPQEEHLVLKEPLECYEDQGGCGRSSNFKLLRGGDKSKTSTFVDTQKVEIQESPEKMRGGDQPQRLTIFVEDDLCGHVSPGDRVVMNGILRSSVRKQHGVKSTIFDIHLDANSVIQEEQEFDEVDITEEEEEEILRFSRDPELYRKMGGSIAPSIFGMEMEKETLLLQLFGGLEKRLPDGTRLRGDMHILLVGDPGVAKSQLVKYMSKLAPRAVYTSGKSSSGAGLTAAAVKDEFGEGRWTLEAGAMVLADRGLLCVDEIDKMSKEDQSSMHEGMEQQSISVAKAGISATLQSRCSVLGAANPKMGRFDEHEPFAGQINFPPALLSRFDVIFVLLDKPEVDKDALLANHILEVHRGGAIHMTLQHEPDGRYTQGDVDRALAKVDPPVEADFLRKYVAYSKRNCFPVLSDEAKRRLSEYYVNLRRQAQGEDGGPVPMTARQLEALVRLSESSSRVRLSDLVEAQDVDRAIRISEYYLRKITGSDGGIMDIDAIASGVSHNQRSQMQIMKEIIKDLSAGTEHGAPWEDITREAEGKGIALDKAKAIVDRMKQNGDIYSPRTDHFRLAR